MLLSAEDLGDQKPTCLLRKMQQLLSDKPEAMDPSPQGTFLQRLASNFRMILVSTANGSNLQELAEMADSVMEIISLSIMMVATPQALSLENLNLKWQTYGGNFRTYRPLGGAEVTGEPDPDHVLHHSLGYVGTTDVLEILLGNAHLHAPSREAIGPAARGDERCWPYTKSLILRNRPCIRTKIPDRHGCGNQRGTTFAYTLENPMQRSQPASH